MITFLLIYAGGFFLSMILLSAFGKSKFNIDYDNIDDRWPDDWDSNAEAYTAWSLAWPALFLLLALVGIWAGLVRIAYFFIHLFGKDNE